MTDSATPGFLDRVRARMPWFDHVLRAQQRYNDSKGDFYAAGITYFTIFAMFPILMVGFAAGGAAYGPALTDVIVMAPESRVFVTGPDVVRSVTGEDVDMASLGGPDTHHKTSGVCHIVAADVGVENLLVLDDEMRGLHGFGHRVRVLHRSTSQPGVPSL